MRVCAGRAPQAGRLTPEGCGAAEFLESACPRGAIGEHPGVVEPSERDNPAASDADLLRAFARSRDDLAFGRLVARHADVVRAVALRATGNAHAAEDVAQATFLVLSGRVGPAMRSAERRGGVRPWLAKTCRYCAANWRRSEQRRRRRERVAAVPEQVDTSQPGEMAEAVETAMSRLSSRDRRLIELHHLGDLPWPQVATELNLTPDAAKRAGARAMERLRESLRGRGVELGAAGVAATLAALSKPAAAAPPSPAAFSIAKGTLTMLKLKTAAVAAALILTAAGTAATAVQLADQQPPPPAPAVVPVVAAAPAAKPGPWAVKLPNGTGVELLAIRRVDPGDKVSAAWQPDGKPADWPAGAVVDRENPLYVTINPFGGGYFEFAVRYTDVDVPTTGHNNTRDDISAFPFLDVNLKNTRDALNPTMGMTADGVRVYAESPNGDANAVAALTHPPFHGGRDGSDAVQCYWFATGFNELVPH